MSDEKPQYLSERFRKMAAAMDHNAEHSKFGGAAVIVLPGPDTETIEILILDSTEDPAQFLATVSTRIQQIVTQINEKARIQMGYGR